MNCIICDEKFNKSCHVSIACPYCAFQSCRACCETYILGNVLTKCMNTSCGKEWTRKFLVSAFTKSFIQGPWKKHREKILLDKEIALLPATQGVVEEQIRKEKLKQEINDIDIQIMFLQHKRRGLSDQMNHGVFAVRATTKFVRACPDGDCRGFLSSQWKCGLCEKTTCNECHVVIGTDRSEHVCDANELATAKLLDKDTKPCPKCSTGIFKIEGCDQMWCTQCHTAFHWRTGMIETRIHNPHFFEWQRQNGGVQRAQGDIICGRELDHRFITNFIVPPLSKITKTKNGLLQSEFRIMQIRIEDIVRSMIHLQNVQVQQFRVDNVENNLKLRVEYMRKVIDKDTFKQRIQRDNKKFEKNREMYDIMQMFNQTVTDILFRFADNLNSVTTQATPMATSVATQRDTQVIVIYDQMISEFAGILQYVNDFLAEISVTYGCKVRKIVPFGVTVFNNGDKSVSVSRDVLVDA